MRYEETRYGFNWGGVEVERIASDEAKGWVVVGLTTPKKRVQVYVTKTGKVRINADGAELEFPSRVAPAEGGAVSG